MRTKAVRLSDDQIEDLVFTADEWSWWENIDGDAIDGFTIEGYNPRNCDNPRQVTISVQFIRNTIDRIIGERLAGWGIIEEAIDHDDFDSNTADLVLQYAVYGEIVFG